MTFHINKSPSGLIGGFMDYHKKAKENYEKAKRMKPVWRVNTGNGMPSNLGDEIIFADGSILESENYGRDGCEWLWDIEGGGSDIYAYQTNRTREAKR